MSFHSELSKALRAAATARSTSAAEADATEQISFSVAGSIDAMGASESEATNSPSMYKPTELVSEINAAPKIHTGLLILAT